MIVKLTPGVKALKIFGRHDKNGKQIPGGSHGMSDVEYLLLSSDFQNFGHHGRNVILAHLIPTEKRLPINKSGHLNKASTLLLIQKK